MKALEAQREDVCFGELRFTGLARVHKVRKAHPPIQLVGAC